MASSTGPDRRSEPQVIARQLLRPLSSAPGVRLVVGTRPDLLPALGSRVKRLQVDQPDYVSLDDLRDYVFRMLQWKVEYSALKQDDHQEALELIAQAVAEKAYPNFLVARIVTRNLIIPVLAIRGRNRSARETGEFSRGGR